MSDGGNGKLFCEAMHDSTYMRLVMLEDVVDSLKRGDQETRLALARIDQRLADIGEQLTALASMLTQKKGRRHGI